MMSATPVSTGDATSGRRRGWRADGPLRLRIRSGLHWWGAALATWLPVRVRELFGLAGRRLLLQHAGGGNVAAPAAGAKRKGHLRFARRLLNIVPAPCAD